MDINYYIKNFERNIINKEASEKFWDFRAEEFNKLIYNSDEQTKLKETIKLINDEKILSEHSEILDIGCGPGKYTLLFGQRVKNVTSLDISKEMLKYAKENADAKGLKNINFIKKTWDEVDLKENGWENKFDLVFASMCPGINNFDTLKKMIDASKGYCFLSTFAYRKDSVANKLEKLLRGKGKENLQGQRVNSIFNILWHLGYFPQIKYIDNQWEKVYTLDKAFDFYTNRFNMHKPLSEEESSCIYNYLSNISVDGEVKEIINSKIAFISWKVK